MAIRYDPAVDLNLIRARETARPAKPERKPARPTRSPQPVPVAPEDSDEPVLSVRQIRAARGLLGWSQAQLATAADVGTATVARVELGNDVKVSSLRAIEHALLDAGVFFIEPDDALGEGARMAKPDG